MKHVRLKVASILTVAASTNGNVMNLLASAVVDVASYAATKGWGQPPQIYALTRKETIGSADPETATVLLGRPDDALIPIEQDPLPPGEPDEVLARIYWPEKVEGCVLVTELRILPAGAEKEAPAEPTAIEKWAASRSDQDARLAVGVLRDGSYTCCLQRRESGEVIVAPGLADDLVAALLATFVQAGTADPDVSPSAG